MSQVLVWRARRQSWVLLPFSLWLGFEPLSEASLHALSYRCVSWWSSLRPRIFGCPQLSPVFFPVPCYGYMFASMTLAPGLRLSLAPSPRSYRMGLEPLSGAPLCALQPPAHSFLVVLAEAACLRKLLDLSIVLPGLQIRFKGQLHCTSSCQQVVFCAWKYLLLVRLRLLPDISLCALWLPARLLWPSLQQRVCESSSLSHWFFPFRGPTPVSHLFLSLRPCRSLSPIPSLAPSMWSPCTLLRWA